MNGIIANQKITRPVLRTGIRLLCRFAVLLTLLLQIVPLTLPPESGAGEAMKLPEANRDGKVSLEKAILERRSVREFRDAPLALAELAQLLWAAQGTTSPSGYRTVPSAGALYPLEIFVLAGKVDGLSPGVYRYGPKNHDLTRTGEGDRRADLCASALNQAPIRRAPAVLVISAFFERTTSKYGERGIRYVHMESGNASQNISLEAVSLGLGTVVIGAFNDKAVKNVVGIGAGEPLLIMPIGNPSD
jgi:SagB-type dehydrogenase family enzyme